LTVPLLPIYWVRAVQASDSLISAVNVAQILTATAAYFLWTRLARVRGKRWVLVTCCLGLSFYPALTAATPVAWLLVPWAAMAGLFAAGVDLTFVDLMMSAGSVEFQPLYVGLYTMSANTAAFLAPLMGTALADWAGLGPALIVGSGLRLAGVALIFLLGVGERRPDTREGYIGARP
jgi:MFS family permease